MMCCASDQLENR